MVNSNMISKSIVSHEEGKMLSSSLSAPDLHTQMSQGETRRVRRRRKKAKGDGAGGDSKKRRLSHEQVKFLEMSFGEEKKLEFGRKLHLAAELGLDPKQVAVWFQNRRVQLKRKQVEKAYNELKSIHDATVVEKCHLEGEVLKLTERLLEAQEEIRKLSMGMQEMIGSSSTLTYQPLVAEGEAELMYMQAYDFDNYMMEWPYFCGI